MTEPEIVKASDLGNNNGYRCPTCKSGWGLNISAISRFPAKLVPDGCQYDVGDVEWEDDDAAWCTDCGWEGVVSELIVVEVDDD